MLRYYFRYIPLGPMLVFLMAFIWLGWVGVSGVGKLLAPATAWEIAISDGQGHKPLAPKIPLQDNQRAPAVAWSDGYEFLPQSGFEIEALVLGARTYKRDPVSEISPVDLALGWGAMSVPGIVEQFDIKQRGRFYYWRSQALPIPRREVVISSANMHMIPSSDAVEKILRSVRKGDVVRLKGHLVNVRHDGDLVWPTSMTRADSGDGACEIIFIEDIQIL